MGAVRGGKHGRHDPPAGRANYAAVLHAAAAGGDDAAQQAGDGIRSVLDGRWARGSLEYVTHVGCARPHRYRRRCQACGPGDPRLRALFRKEWTERKAVDVNG